tara:strand:+ start:2810 stop:3274 length:465 start_codon:yes stop_codon:yes gene_type:complete
MSKCATDYTYFNLRTHEFSVRYRGKVRAHADRLLILPGEGRERVGFNVSEAGRQRVLEEQRKNVHAYVVGDAWIEDGDAFACKTIPARSIKATTDVIEDIEERYGDPVAVSYNPYKGGTFYRKDSGEPIEGAEAVIALSGHGNYPPLLLAYSPR